AVEAIDRGFVQGEIEEASFRYQQEVEAGERVIVGVNRFAEAESEAIELHRIDPEAGRRQLGRTGRGGGGGGAAAGGAGVGGGGGGGGRRGEQAPADPRGAAGAVHRRRGMRAAPLGMGHVRRPLTTGWSGSMSSTGARGSPATTTRWTRHRGSSTRSRPPSR